VTIDPNGNRASLAYPNGTATAYTYDRLNRLTDLNTLRGPATIQRYIFTLAPAGNREKIEEHDDTVRTYDYDDLFRLTGEAVSGAFNYAKVFTYDPVGNRLRQVTTGFGAADVSYTYDTRDRLLTEGAQAYSWDDNGNLISKDAEATYFWDFENRLVKVQKVDGTVVEHLYDPDGNRVQTNTTIGAVTTPVNYLVDTSGSLSHVVAETDGSNNLTAYYVRADDLLAVMRPDGGGGFISRFYHADGLGSVRRLTDENGIITDGYTYSAFGELLAHTGTDPQPYTFAGEPYDPNVGFYYNRARWLDPRVGLFTGQDPLDGAVESPSSLHRYLYANQDPANQSDPTGLASFVTTGFSISVLGRISAISLPVFRAALQWVYVNYFTIHTFASRLATAVEIATAGLAALELTAAVADRMASQLASYDEVYPEGNFPRGFEVGRRAGQNLADDFPKIDHYEGNIAVSLKSTTQVEDSGTFLKNVREAAEELRDTRGQLRGRTATGQRILVDMRQARGRALLVVIPMEPLGWNPTSISRQLASLSARTRVLIRVVPVRGLRGL
jgi:RHS repeat-associated protein